MDSLATYGRRIRETLAYYVGGVVQQMQDKAVFIWAQAIAFKVLIAIVPVIILATGILALLEWPINLVRRYVREFLPGYQSDQLIEFLFNLQDAGITLLSIGGIGLILTAMTLFTTLRVVIANVFQEEWHEQRSILGGYAFDLRMVGQVGLLFLLSLGMSFALQTYTINFSVLEQLGLDYARLQQGWDQVIRWTGLVVPFLLTVAMFFQLFYFIPKPHPPKRCALLGTFVTALMWEAAKYGFTVYASHLGRFSRYGGTGEEALGGLGGFFGLIIAFVFWAYFSGVVLIIGALVALLSEKQHRNRQRVEQARRTRERLRTQRARVSAAHEAQPTSASPSHDDASDARDDSAEASSRQNLPVS